MITVRYALREELQKVNKLRKMVNDLHVSGRPDIFRSGFNQELQDRVYLKFDSEDSDVIVALIDDEICGFSIVDYVCKPLSPYNLERRFYNVEEFGVDDGYRRRGVASALIDFCRKEAKDKGFDRMELDMWEFNAGALAFYEAAGFSTYRRYMELDV